MSTRSNFVISDEHESIQIYRHWDGYPTAVLPDLAQVFKYAWKLPRFEASDFSAAIVRAWKEEGGGNIRIDSSLVPHGDIEWLYRISKDKVIVDDLHGHTTEVPFDKLTDAELAESIEQKAS